MASAQEVPMLGLTSSLQGGGDTFLPAGATSEEQEKWGASSSTAGLPSVGSTRKQSGTRTVVPGDGAEFSVDARIALAGMNGTNGNAPVATDILGFGSPTSEIFPGRWSAVRTNWGYDLKAIGTGSENRAALAA